MIEEASKQFAQDLEPLIVELKNAYDSLAKIEAEYDQARTAYQEVDHQLDRAREGVSGFANVFAYCLKHECDPTQIGWDHTNNKDPYAPKAQSGTIFAVPNRGSRLTRLPDIGLEYFKDRLQKKGWRNRLARLFRSQH